MGVSSAAAKIWGISGPHFLILYAVAAAVLLVAALWQRHLRFEGPRTLRNRYLQPEIAAYLTGGRAAPLHAALAELRVAGTIAVTSSGRLQSHQPRGGRTDLERAVHRAAR